MLFLNTNHFNRLNLNHAPEFAIGFSNPLYPLIISTCIFKHFKQIFQALKHMFLFYFVSDFLLKY